MDDGISWFTKLNSVSFRFLYNFDDFCIQINSNELIKLFADTEKSISLISKTKFETFS